MPFYVFGTKLLVNESDIIKDQPKNDKKIDNELSIQYAKTQQKSNDFKFLKPASDQYKDSEGYLHPNTNNGLSTVDKAATPYFRLHTPAKMLSKSNITFNSQSKINPSQ